MQIHPRTAATDPCYAEQERHYREGKLPVVTTSNRAMIWFLWLIAVLLVGCGATPPAPTAPPATTAPQLPTLNALPDTDGLYTSLPQSITSEGYHVLGAPDAPVTLVMYSDFLCGACAYHVTELEPTLLAEFVQPGTVKLVYRHLAQLGESSLLTAEAVECAADQQRFWEMRAALYANQIGLFSSGGRVRAFLEQIAATQGLDQAAFAACLDNQTHRAAVEADFAAATAAGVRSRPVFDIQGTGDPERLIGALPLSQFRESLGNATP